MAWVDSTAYHVNVFDLDFLGKYLIFTRFSDAVRIAGMIFHGGLLSLSLSSYIDGIDQWIVMDVLIDWLIDSGDPHTHNNFE